MSYDKVVECDECGHRVMIVVDYPGAAGPVLCGCGEFEKMDTVREGEQR